MTLVAMSHEEYIQFCNKIANRYFLGLIICVIISVSGFVIMIYMKVPLISYWILAIGSSISILGLGINYMRWKYQ